MRKAAAIVSLSISALLFLVLIVSFAIAWQTAQKRLDGSQTDAEIAAQNAGKEVIEPTDNTPDGSTMAVEGLGGAAFLVAGLALWPKR